ncbi:hypothetical protein D3C78_1057850 [compost metagenome]
MNDIFHSWHVLEHRRQQDLTLHNGDKLLAHLPDKPLLRMFPAIALSLPGASILFYQDYGTAEYIAASYLIWLHLAG